MTKLKMTVAAILVVICCTNVEARGRRGGQAYMPYNYYNYNYNVAPTTAGTVVSTTPVVSTTAPQSGVVQTSATDPAGAVTTAKVELPAGETAATTTTTPAAQPVVQAPKVAAVGSAQWKAEQSARMGSVAHIGGGFGGGSFEGNGFGATPDQAIQNSCFWGQRTPIEIGVARGANGYYATVFYR